MSKFKIGDIVRHKATKINEGTRMVVMAVGSLKFETSETIIYQLSGERAIWSRPVGEALYTGVYVSEVEIVSADYDESKF